MEIKRATSSDLEEIQAIYAHHVLNGTGTFEEVPPTLSEMAARMAKGEAAGYSWLVATNDSKVVVGFGYFGPFRERIAYRHTVENTVYVRDDYRGQGIGKKLLNHIIAAATDAGFHQMLAVIGDSNNLASIKMHADLGFEQAGCLRSIGVKFGRTLDVVIMQYHLRIPSND